MNWSPHVNKADSSPEGLVHVSICKEPVCCSSDDVIYTYPTPPLLHRSSFSSSWGSMERVPFVGFSHFILFPVSVLSYTPSLLPFYVLCCLRTLTATSLFLALCCSWLFMRKCSGKLYSKPSSNAGVAFLENGELGKSAFDKLHASRVKWECVNTTS
jgi:hypothetical protein